MSGSLGRISLGNKVCDPLLREPRKPQRHGVITHAGSAMQRELEDATLNIELRQVSNVSDAFRNASSLSPHKSNSPRSNPERVWNGPAILNESNRLISLTVPFLPTAFFFGQTVEQFRLVTAVTTPANDNVPWREAEAA